jgi:NADH:ubiquinone oxidoreductase subunit 2 (subunit N)
LLIVATILSVLAYARVVAVVWWGGKPDEPPVPPDQPSLVSVWASEPRRVVAAITVLLAAALVTGLFPGLLQDWIVR